MERAGDGIGSRLDVDDDALSHTLGRADSDAKDLRLAGAKIGDQSANLGSAYVDTDYDLVASQPRSSALAARSGKAVDDTRANQVTPGGRATIICADLSPCGFHGTYRK